LEVALFLGLSPAAARFASRAAFDAETILGGVYGVEVWVGSKRFRFWKFGRRNYVLVGYLRRGVRA
jgi:uncharacterized protein (DUF779 family)